MDGHEITEFGAKMLTSVNQAGGGLRGRDSSPWVVLAEYVAEIERRLSELEAKAALRE